MVGGLVSLKELEDKLDEFDGRINEIFKDPDNLNELCEQIIDGNIAELLTKIVEDPTIAPEIDVAQALVHSLDIHAPELSQLATEEKGEAKKQILKSILKGVATLAEFLPEIVPPAYLDLRAGL